MSDVAVNWLPLSLLKGVDAPRVRIAKIWGQGCYWVTRSLIEISEGIAEDGDVAGTLAHEFCHHLQGLDGRGSAWRSDLPYEDAIREYFKQPWEREALRFELKLAPRPLSEWWWFDLCGYQKEW